MALTQIFRGVGRMTYPTNSSTRTFITVSYDSEINKVVAEVVDEDGHNYGAYGNLLAPEPSVVSFIGGNILSIMNELTGTVLNFEFEPVNLIYGGTFILHNRIEVVLRTCGFDFLSSLPFDTEGKKVMNRGFAIKLFGNCIKLLDRGGLCIQTCTL